MFCSSLAPRCLVIVAPTIEGAIPVGSTEKTLHLILVQIHRTKPGVYLIVIIVMDALFTVACHTFTSHNKIA
jgi:hypothetical protein